MELKITKSVLYAIKKGKYLLRLVLIRNKSIVWCINSVLRIFNKDAFYKSLKSVEQADICEIHTLSTPIRYYPIDYVIDNNYYGISHSFKSYADLDIKYSSSQYIEHGVFFGRFILFDEKHWFSKRIITFSAQRKKHIKSLGIMKEIHVVGPYIEYAPVLGGRTRVEEYKNRFGKTLLVFPSHSINGRYTEYNLNSFIKKINSIKAEYDSVLVSLFWVDTQNADLVNRYRAQNYHICTAGHIHDINFLSRLRLLIEIADFTMSNNTGTHVGYCVALNKAHYIFHNEVREQRTFKKDYFDESYRAETYKLETDEVKHAFSIYDENITAAQREVVSKYWGLGTKLSKYEMRALLSDNENENIIGSN